MKSQSIRFNIILITLATALLACGCKSTKTEKPATTKKAVEDPAKKYKKDRAMVQLFLESPRGTQGHAVPILRDQPVYVNVGSAPFIEWHHVTNAELVEYDDGFAIKLFFDPHGTFVLDTVTTANRNRRIVILAQVAKEKSRWLAAPKILQRNASGVLSFTPDATRDEAERIVWGIRNTIAEAKRQGTL